MSPPDPLDAVSSDVASRAKAILTAVATGGTYGLKAYEQSIASTGLAKTDAITRAQERAGLIGGPEAQGFEGQASSAYDRGISNLSGARAGFEANMTQLGAAHKNYLDQVNAAVPLVRADTQRQLALKQQAIDAEREQEAAKEAKANKPKLSEILNLSQNIGSMYADQPGDSPLRGTVEERLQPNGLFPKLGSVQTVEGSASINPNRNWVTDDLMMTAADQAAYNGTSVEFELAKIAAEVSGLDPASSVAPTDVKPYLRTEPTQNPIAKSLATKYDTKGVDYNSALDMVNDPDFKSAVNYLVTNANGTTTREAADAWLRENFKDPWVYLVLAGEYLPLYRSAK